MIDPNSSVRQFYADSTQYRSRLVDGIRDLTPDQLGIGCIPDGPSCFDS